MVVEGTDTTGSKSSLDGIWLERLLDKDLQHRRKVLLPNRSVVHPGSLPEQLLPLHFDGPEDCPVQRLQVMSKVSWQSQQDDVVCLCQLDEAKGQVGKMPIKDEHPGLVAHVLCIREENFLEPVQELRSLHPAFGAGVVSCPGRSAFSPTLVQVYTFVDDVGREQLSTGRSCTVDSYLLPP